MSIQEHITKKVIELCKLHDIKSICDYGCGDGKLLSSLREHLENVRLIGVDCFDELEKLGQEKPTFDGIDFFDRDSAEFSKWIEGNQVDLVISLHALHHYEHPIQELKNIKKLLSLSGLLYAVDFNFNVDDDFVKNSMNSLISESVAALARRYHRHPFTEKQAEDLLSAVFDNITSEDIFTIHDSKEDSFKYQKQNQERCIKFLDFIREKMENKFKLDYLERIVEFQLQMSKDVLVTKSQYFGIIAS